jgi:hypothetical protein
MSDDGQRAARGIAGLLAASRGGAASSGGFTKLASSVSFADESVELDSSVDARLRNQTVEAFVGWSKASPAAGHAGHAASHGCLHIGNVRDDLEHEAALTDIFGEFGMVVCVTIRHRDSAILGGDGKKNETSWALLSFGAADEASAALEAAARLRESHSLVVRLLDIVRARTSTGGMGTILRTHEERIKRQWIKLAPIFRGLADISTFVSTLAAELRDRTVAAGDVFIRKGEESGREVYFVAEGSCEILNELDDDRPRATLEAGSYVGELATLAARPDRYTYCVRAGAGCQLFALSHSALDEICVRYPGAMEVMCAPADRRRDRLVSKFAESVAKNEQRRLELELSVTGVELSRQNTSAVGSIVPVNKTLQRMRDKVNAVMRVDQKARMKVLFEELDSDGNGYLDHKEIATLFTRLGLRLKKKKLAAAFAQIDTDEDGEISLDEFTTWYYQRLNDQERAEFGSVIWFERGVLSSVANSSSKAVKYAPMLLIFLGQMTWSCVFAIMATCPSNRFTEEMFLFQSEGGEIIVDFAMDSPAACDLLCEHAGVQQMELGFGGAACETAVYVEFGQNDRSTVTSNVCYLQRLSSDGLTNQTVGIFTDQEVSATSTGKTGAFSHIDDWIVAAGNLIYGGALMACTWQLYILLQHPNGALARLKPTGERLDEYAQATSKRAERYGRLIAFIGLLPAISMGYFTLELLFGPPGWFGTWSESGMNTILTMLPPAQCVGDQVLTVLQVLVLVFCIPSGCLTVLVIYAAAVSLWYAAGYASSVSKQLTLHASDKHAEIMSEKQWEEKIRLPVIDLGHRILPILSEWTNAIVLTWVACWSLALCTAPYTVRTFRPMTVYMLVYASLFPMVLTLPMVIVTTKVREAKEQLNQLRGAAVGARSADAVNAEKTGTTMRAAPLLSYLESLNYHAGPGFAMFGVVISPLLLTQATTAVAASIPFLMTVTAAIEAAIEDAAIKQFQDATEMAQLDTMAHEIQHDDATLSRIESELAMLIAAANSSSSSP